MITHRKAQDRGEFDFGWLHTRHSFSFGDYYDPAHMGFRALRVINEDTVQPGQGFGTHPHRDMEILSYVLEGTLAHRDSMGTGARIAAGEWQRITAGTGVQHSEFNASMSDPVHFLQIWIVPEARGLPPSWEQKRFDDVPSGVFRLVASRDGRDGSLTVHQDVALYTARFDPGQRFELQLAPGRHAWLQAARGEVSVNGQTLRAGDGAGVSDETALRFEGRSAGEVLVFDLA
ncbi:MAG: pirin family protein [Myxococcaceae bacterium]|nr:pirin family protein [Myxococcaceae bacterium]